MDNLSRLASDYLIKKYNPHTLILYGSRARGDFSVTSDIDIACFCDEIPATKEALLFHEVYLDAWIYPLSYMSSVSDDALRFSESLLVLDKHGYGARYLAAVQERLKLGPEKLSQSDREHLIHWINKMLGRVRYDDPGGNYRKAWLQFELLETYFKLRGLWFLGDKKSFAYLKENDKEGYQLFVASYGDLQNYDNLKRLAAYVTKF